MYLNIKHNVAWTMLGNGIYAASQWLNIVVLAHIGGAIFVGKFALALAITAPVMLFCNLSLRAVLVTDAANDFSLRNYVTLRYLTSSIALFIILFLCIFYKDDSEQLLIILFIGIAKFFESISDIYYGINQKNHRLDSISKSLILRGFIGCTALSSIFYLTNNLVFSCAIYAASWAAVFLFYDRKMSVIALVFSTEIREPRDVKLIVYKQLIKTALPLGIAALLVSLNWNIPRYFVEHSLGKENLGIFSALIYLVIIGNMVINSIGQSINAHLASAYITNDINKFIQYTSKALLVALLIGICGIILSISIGNYALAILYGKSFAQYSDILILISFGAILTYITNILGHAITSTRRFKNLLFPYIIVTLTIVISSAILIPQYGLKGAAYTFIAFGIVDLTAHIFLFWRLYESRKA